MIRRLRIVQYLFMPTCRHRCKPAKQPVKCRAKDLKMKTLLNVRDWSEVLDRLANVRPDTRPRWGTMSSHQMICHLSDSLRAALREKYISPSTSLFKRTILKPLALWVLIPWPHGFKTRPEMDQQQGGTTPVEFSSDIEELRILFGV